jgi:hypothetical protein
LTVHILHRRTQGCKGKFFASYVQENYRTVVLPALDIGDYESASSLFTPEDLVFFEVLDRTADGDDADIEKLRQLFFQEGSSALS